MKSRINMITLGVNNLEESIRFYERGLGFPRKPFEGEVAFFELNGTWLALYPWDALAEDATVSPEGTGFRGITLAHNVANKTEVDNVMEQAGNASAAIVKPAKDVFWGGYSGYFADPDGYLWEVVWNPLFWPGPDDG